MKMEYGIIEMWLESGMMAASQISPSVLPPQIEMMRHRHRPKPEGP